ncbi:MAG: metallophosphoesterase [Phycisphaerae bacterium]
MEDRVLIAKAVIWLFVTMTSVGVIVALQPFARIVRPKPRMLEFVAIALIGTACAGGAAVLMLVFGFGAFALIRVTYLFLAVVMPVIGICLAIRYARSRPRARITAGLATILLVPAPLAAYASWIEPGRLRVETAELPHGEIFGDQAIRIVVLADLQTDHVGAYERRCIERINALKPDIVLMTGDYLQLSNAAFSGQAAAFRGLMNEIRAPGGVFAVFGDVDPPARTRALFNGTNVIVLENRVSMAYAGARRIAIGGVALQCDQQAAREAIRALAETPADYRILIAHRPDVAFAAGGVNGIDLIVAGHTHGGQVVFPGFGPPITLSHVPRRVASGGLHEIGEQTIYVSRGVGMERGMAPPVRFWCPPELTLLTSASE